MLRKLRNLPARSRSERDVRYAPISIVCVLISAWEFSSYRTTSGDISTPQFCDPIDPSVLAIGGLSSAIYKLAQAYKVYWEGRKVQAERDNIRKGEELEREGKITPEMRLLKETTKPDIGQYVAIAALVKSLKLSRPN